MKIRNGFISNSSSSSFCIAKCYIPEDKLEDIRRAIQAHNEEDHSEGGYIYEHPLYFFGEMAYWTENDAADVRRALQNAGVDSKYYGCMS